ncbi:MAG: hypothetical protein CXT79_01070 [Thaumarchaeota archaeon]|nr:MAG: hypothetical protein CXT79_01070 [Nitrososphaerota archaeon]
MREILVSKLFQELLGPRTGDVYETLNSNQLPVSEFTTGILSPKDSEQSITVMDNQADNLIPSDRAHGISSAASGLQGDSSDDSEITSMINPSLNPQKKPSSMGMSFQTKSSDIPEFDICLTWARYLPSSKTSPEWKRSPKYALLTIPVNLGSDHYFDSFGKKCSEADSEISFHVKSKNVRENIFLISLFFVNRIKIPVDWKGTDSQFHIFQPQIRVVKKDGTEVIPMKDTSHDPESMKTELLYKNRPFYARGHMTSVVWKSVDPEIIDDETKSQFPGAVDLLGFSWADRTIVPQDKVTPFLTPDLRTEYIPMHSILSPKIKWRYQDKLELDAKILSQMWDFDTLDESLRPIVTQYDLWISDLKKAKIDPAKNPMEIKNNELVDEIIEECNNVSSRIKSGIELLKDDDVRLSFCFANMAINLQTQWNRNQDFKYRPFQLAFILMSMESIVSKDSLFRDTCDLLWVPTGGGKTEAYLVLVALEMGYRRLDAIKHGKSGAGVSVITRYTLRLLTIQQFRRSLSMFTAAEFLRVENVNSKKPIGWRPDQCSNANDVLWGSTPFSVGMWVGAGVTPNKLEDIPLRTPPYKIPQALTILKNNSQGNSTSEPAQILNCPTCKNILAISSKGFDPNVEITIKLIIQSTSKASSLISAMSTFSNSQITLVNCSISEINPGYFVFEIRFKNKTHTNSRTINVLWDDIRENFKVQKLDTSLQSTSAARPGYFFKKYNSSNHGYDFEIFCTNSSCPLNKNWFGGSPMGGVNDTSINMSSMTNTSNNITLNDGNKLLQVQKCFMTEDFVSDRIPIPGMTVDEQVYQNLPTMVVATVDKFARLPFEPRASGLFGNVEYYHILHGYYRPEEEDGKPNKYSKTVKSDTYRRLELKEIPTRPNFIIQDELHLLEGPLGSLTGLYETSVDFLSRSKHKIKYIASTATIKRGDDQVKSLFDRELQVFPPNGVDVDDRFFISERKEPENHPLVENEDGRLYFGVLAPGKGALTPIVRIWSRLAQTVYENKADPDIDRFWTLVGYFNAIRELGGTTSLYRQDIPQRIREISTSSRNLFDSDKVELSGRTPSDHLPSILDTLDTKYPKAPDALFTTSMFGTGIDIQRLGLMLVTGQPKTTSSYIQSTGRVGRRKGALVVVYFRSTRPRDLSHYEYFIRHHVQIHRTVESPTVYPFSPTAVDKALGPNLVAMLRNMRNPTTPWNRKNSSRSMRTASGDPEMDEIMNFVEDRVNRQPEKRKPEDITKEILDKLSSNIATWRSMATDEPELPYWTIDKEKPAVVLGDLIHENDGADDVVFSNSPQSLRDLEGETGFGT